METEATNFTRNQTILKNIETEACGRERKKKNSKKWNEIGLIEQFEIKYKPVWYSSGIS